MLLHDLTHKAVQDFIVSPSHALLITGQIGAGKGSLARLLAAQLLKLENESRLDSHPYVKQLDEPESSWSIETIRALAEFMKLKTTGSGQVRRVLILEQAQLLTTEAQNASLKLLEEPSADTVIILTSANAHELLPTIRSRVQQIAIKVPSLPQATEYFSKHHTTTAIERAYYMSDGGTGLMSALLEGDESHQIAQSILQAKALLQTSTFERLAQIDTLTKKKGVSPHLVGAIRRIASAAIRQAVATNNQNAVRRWNQVAQNALSAEQALNKNAQPKLVLTDLFLSL